MKKRSWTKINLLCTVSAVVIVSALSYGQKTGFSGKWKGEIAPAAPARGTGAPTTGNRFIQRGGGGGFGGFGGGGGAFGGSSRPQKVTLNLKTKDKDTKASGNITVGESNPEDVKEGRIEGNRIMFSAGRAPAPLYEYTGELRGDELFMERWVSGTKGAVTAFTLKRD
jgi:hypothetical protein